MNRLYSSIVTIISFFTFLFFDNSEKKQSGQTGREPILTAAEREFLVITLNDSFEKFQRATQSASERQLYFKASAKSWSIAECIEHVTLAEIHFPQIVEAEMKKPAAPAYRRNIKIKDEKIRPKMLSRLWSAKSPEIYQPSGKFENVGLAQKSVRDTQPTVFLPRIIGAFPTGSNAFSGVGDH